MLDPLSKSKYSRRPSRPRRQPPESSSTPCGLSANINSIASVSKASSARNSSLTVCSGVLVAGAGCFAPFRNFRQKRRYKQLASGTKEAFTMRP
jgi:hypothetical protein